MTSINIDGLIPHYYMYNKYTGYTQKNGAVSIVKTIETAPFFCVYPVLYLYQCYMFRLSFIIIIIYEVADYNQLRSKYLEIR
jgi:hypothetical protein